MRRKRALHNRSSPIRLPVGTLETLLKSENTDKFEAAWRSGVASKLRVSRL